MSDLRVVPLTLAQANAAVLSLHRHHKPAQGHRFSIGLMEREKLVGAAIVGRPVSRGVDPYNVAEVTRLVTDGTKNACSMLYSACARAAAAMGFVHIQTYILDSEPGTSLRASGWELVGTTSLGHVWQNRDGRRTDQPMGVKQRWQKVLAPTLGTHERND